MTDASILKEKRAILNDVCIPWSKEIETEIISAMNKSKDREAAAGHVVADIIVDKANPDSYAQWLKAKFGNDAVQKRSILKYIDEEDFDILEKRGVIVKVEGQARYTIE